MVAAAIKLSSVAVLVLGLALMVSCQRPRVSPAPPKAEPIPVQVLLQQVAQSEPTAQETPADEVVPAAPLLDANGEEVSTKAPLTGIPQIDYIWDPNLPRELNGYNMSNYPFYRSIPSPEKIAFKCDGLHDGFYASVQLKCQVYHQCLFGQRYDFLCANYTAFDQKNFICHFANEVDCDNAPLYYDRNEALYKTTTTEAPLPARFRFAAEGRRRGPNGARRRRPQRPVYYDDYYDYEYEEYDDVPGNEDSVQDEESPASKTEGDSNSEPGENKAAKRRPANGGRRPGQNRGGGGVFANPNRPPPRIRPPVPNNVAEAANSQDGPAAKKGKKKPSTTPTPEEEEEFEEEEEEEVAPSTTRRPKARKNRPTSTTTARTTTTTTAKPEEDYEYYDDEETTTTTTRRPRKGKTTVAPTTTTTTKATTTTSTEEPELPSKPNPSLFLNRKGPITNILQRRGAGSKTTTPSQEEAEEEDEELEGSAEEATTASTTTTTTTTTGAPARRTTPSRPARPAPTQRSRGATRNSPVVSAEAEEEALVTKGTSSSSNQPLPQAEPASEEVTQVRGSSSARRIRPISPTKRDETAAATADVTQDSRQDETSRQGRDMELEAVEEDDEELAESQHLSVLSLFSRVLPQRT